MYDVIIIGSGPAGISAGIYLKRAKKNILIISNGKSALEKAERIENYYGIESISGKDLYEIGIKQAKNLKIPIENDEVINISYNNEKISLTEALSIWQSPLEHIFPSKVESENVIIKPQDYPHRSSLKKTTLIPIRIHIDPYIRHQPLKISEVLRLPPIANAKGAVIVRTARITYRSAISRSSRSTLNMIIRPHMMTSSQEAVSGPKMLSSTSVTLTASGMFNAATTLDVISKIISQI